MLNTKNLNKPPVAKKTIDFVKKGGSTTRKNTAKKEKETQVVNLRIPSDQLKKIDEALALKKKNPLFSTLPRHSFLLFLIEEGLKK